MSHPLTSADGTNSPDDSERTRIPLGLRIVVLLLVALASSSAYLTRHCLAVASTTIQAELNLNSEDMGWVFKPVSGSPRELTVAERNKKTCPSANC